MCSIIGALAWMTTPAETKLFNADIDQVFAKSIARGRDGWGWEGQADLTDGVVDFTQAKSIARGEHWSKGAQFFRTGFHVANLIGNMRAEPTTEYVADKLHEDQQPYRLGNWAIVHNGTIANDANLRSHRYPTRIDSAAIVEQLALDDMEGKGPREVAYRFAECVSHLKGSYAILAKHLEHPDMILVACNYRPIWFARLPKAFFFASSRDYLPDGAVPQMVPPYSAWAFSTGEAPRRLYTQTQHVPSRALVVCSGGLDSVVSAAWAKDQGYDVELCHFQYGSRAEGPEHKAIVDVATALDVPLHFIPMKIYDPKDSPLLRADSTIAGGEAGAEFAHEWVPARNLVMLSIATAFAEARGFDLIVLGNNLEEAGAYPDNEPEFIARFNDLLPFAVADGKKVQVIMPVGNMMKHEIVALGHQLGAPLDKTWSCYRAGAVHCGTCGPCYMRRTAFAINGLPEVIPYANEKE